jgi:hypothetical protein
LAFRAFARRDSARVRILLFCLLLILLGSPPVQDPLLNALVAVTEPDQPNSWLYDWVFLPGWLLSASAVGGDVVALIADDVGVVILLAGIFVLAPRRLFGKALWLRCVLACAGAAEVASLLSLAAFPLFDHDPFRDVLPFTVPYTLHSLVFGVVIGTVLRLVYAIPTAGRRKSRMTTIDGPVRGPVGSVPGDVTRYLCAAAYLDEQFADRVVDDVLADEAGAVAPSVDVDLTAVAYHCLAAREKRYQRDKLLTIGAGIVTLVGPIWLLLAPIFLTLAGPSSGDGGTTHGRGRRQRVSTRTLVLAGLRFGVVLVFAALVALLFSDIGAPGWVHWLLGGYLFGIPIVIALIGVAVLAHRTTLRHELEIDQRLRTSMSREIFAARPLPTVAPEWIADRMNQIDEAQQGNVTIYSGYIPFVGFAKASSNWSVAVALLPDSSADEQVDFTVVELIDYVRGQLTTAHARSGELASLQVEDRVFVNGATITGDARFLPTVDGMADGPPVAPVQRLDREQVEDIMRHPTSTVRHFLAMHVPLWGGDVVPSVFLHFSTTGGTLHLHCDNHVLGPVDAAYHVVDRMLPQPAPEQHRWLLMSALSSTAAAYRDAPRQLLHHARFGRRQERRIEHEAAAYVQDPMFDYGARLSVREIALSPEYHNYFQVLDASRIIASVQRHTLAAIRDFLEAHGFDTRDFHSQQQTILNHGVIQQGGLSVVGNQAIGSGANATQHVGTQPNTVGATE